MSRTTGPIALGAVVTALTLVATTAPAGAETPPAPDPATSTQMEAPAPQEQAPQEQAAPDSADGVDAQAAATPASIFVTTSAGTITSQDPFGIRVLAKSQGKRLTNQPVRIIVKSRTGTPRQRVVDRTTDGNGYVKITHTSISPGTYGVMAQVLPQRGYALASSASDTLTVQTGNRVSLFVNDGRDSSVRPGENFVLRGKARKPDNKPEAGGPVRIYKVLSNGSKSLRKIVRTSSGGSYHWMPTSRESGTYVAMFSDTRYSQRITVSVKSGKRTLESRRAAARYELGAARTGVRKVREIRYQKFALGTLTEWGGETFLTPRRMDDQLRKQGNPGGKIGIPVADHLCGLMEGACLQRFTWGAIYANPNAMHKATSSAGVTGRLAKFVAVGLSQVDYDEPYYRGSKYGKWIGQTGAEDAWCGYFQAWIAYAAKSPGAIVKADSFDQMVAAERKRDRLRSTPSIGRLAYMNYAGPVHHVGLVVKYDSKYIWAVEGNVDGNGGPGKPRGINYVKRPRSVVAFYAAPLY